MFGDLRYEVSWTPDGAMIDFDFSDEFWTDKVPYETRHFTSLDAAKKFATQAQKDDHWGEANIYSQSDQGFAEGRCWVSQWKTEGVAYVDDGGVSAFEPY